MGGFAFQVACLRLVANEPLFMRLCGPCRLASIARCQTVQLVELLHSLQAYLPSRIDRKTLAHHVCKHSRDLYSPWVNLWFLASLDSCPYFRNSRLSYGIRPEQLSIIHHLNRKKISLVRVILQKPISEQDKAEHLNPLLDENKTLWLHLACRSIEGEEGNDEPFI